ncbi:TetR/AcrR family transcriptional regulator [Pseudonocardia alni]|uniref:TetR/AcrR family transcriptional regulator n=1 Tax=Pseudonocardia alni TaxID=33907 RepID=UPI003320C3DC
MSATPGQQRDRRPRRSARRRTLDHARRAELLHAAESILLREGFTAVTMDELAQQLRCSKATLYSVAATKEQLVLAVTRHFFATSTTEVEEALAEEYDHRRRVSTYLEAVGNAMRRSSPAFYDDMVGYEPTARIYHHNARAAAERVRNMIDDGVRDGVFREVDGTFAAQVVALVIHAVQSGDLLDATGLSAGDAFSELGDLLLNGLSRPSVPDPAPGRGTREPAP